MPALMIARSTIKNSRKFQEYAAKATESAAQYEGEVLFRGMVDRELTGKPEDHQFAVIVRFPSLGKIDEWCGSDAYQSLDALRDEAANIRITSYDLPEYVSTATLA